MGIKLPQLEVHKHQQAKKSERQRYKYAISTFMKLFEPSGCHESLYDYNMG